MAHWNNLIALDAQLNGKKMNNTTTPQNNYFVLFTRYIRSNYKIISGSLIVIFILFLSYQYYSYISIQNIHKNSITYFDAKDLESNHDFYTLMEKLYSNKDFYSVVSTLENININIENNNFFVAEELYLKLLDDNNLKPVYIAAIASHASYTFLNVLFDNSNMNLVSTINNFINYINDSLNSYKGIKLELKYLLAIAEQDQNTISQQNNLNTNDLYKLIMESKDISSSIKERVNKIHEFQVYK